MTNTNCSGGRPTVLIVDDEPLIVKSVTRMLGPIGCEILTATSGAEALEMYLTRDQPIALLLTDLHMPAMNGRVLSAALRRIQPGLKILYMTGWCDELFGTLTELEAHEAFIDKPVTPTSIREAVSQSLYGALGASEHVPPRLTGGTQRVGLTQVIGASQPCSPPACALTLQVGDCQPAAK